MHIEFKKIELAGMLTLKLEYTQTDEGRITKLKSHADALIHDDLRDAMQGLAAHFVLLTEMKKKNDVMCTYFLGQNTVDERMYQLILQKRHVANTITGATDKIEMDMVGGVMNLFK